MSQTVGDFFWNACMHGACAVSRLSRRRDQRSAWRDATAAKGKIKFVQVRHEEMAAFMASAYAKFTGELGVCMATSGRAPRI